MRKLRKVVLFVKMKYITLLTSLMLSISSVFAHTNGDSEFNPGINPLEYFLHGHFIYGILVIGLWVLILWGMYTLVLMVMHRHVK